MWFHSKTHISPFLIIKSSVDIKLEPFSISLKGSSHWKLTATSFYLTLYITPKDFCERDQIVAQSSAEGAYLWGIQNWIMKFHYGFCVSLLNRLIHTDHSVWVNSSVLSMHHDPRNRGLICLVTIVTQGQPVGSLLRLDCRCRLDHQPLFGKGAGGRQTRDERAAEIEPITVEASDLFWYVFATRSIYTFCLRML